MKEADQEKIIAEANIKANKKLQKLKTQLKEFDQKISKSREAAPSADVNNAKRLLAGCELDELGQPSADLREQRRALTTAIELQQREIRRIEAKKRIRLELLKPWGEYGAGSKILFDPRKGLPLIKNGVAIEIKSTDKKGDFLSNEAKKQGNGKIRLKLLKKWGGFGAGSVVDFGESKGRLLITNGTAVEVSKKEKLITLGIGKLGVLANV